jgi:hypothetical protein
MSAMKLSTVKPGLHICKVMSSTNRATTGAGDGVGQYQRIRPPLSSGIQGVVGLGDGNSIGVPPGDSGMNGINVVVGVSAEVTVTLGVGVLDKEALLLGV